MPVVVSLSRKRNLVRFRGAFELLLPFSYCAKKKERKCLSVTTIFSGTSPMVFTTHTYTQKSIYIYVTSTVYRLECEEKEEINYEEI